MSTIGEAEEACEAPGCKGAPLQGAHCLEHATADELADAAVTLCSGAPLVARNAKISPARIHALLSALKARSGKLEVPAANFTGSTFSGDASFSGVTFLGNVVFESATFSGTADFSVARFEGHAASFDLATFCGDARFVGTQFMGDGHFGSATFEATAAFGGANFGRTAAFAGAHFAGAGRFASSTFSGNADFIGATFSSDAQFDRALFSSDASFDRTTFSRVGSFHTAKFERASQLGPLAVGEQLVLDRCLFVERVRIEAAAIHQASTFVISARSTKFAGGVHLGVRRAEVALDDADFARASTLSGTRGQDVDSDISAGETVRQVEEPRSRLITLRGASVAALLLADIDLRACRFFGAHGLESLSIEASCRWPRTPPERRYIEHDRETIAEEAHWRGWSSNDPAMQTPRWLEGRDGGDRLEAGQIAALYRALRKAREDDKDEAGAGDLYYGEMEMRRRSAPAAPERGRARRRGDHAILYAYWLFSGYGMRPARALASLTVTLLGGALLLWLFGFHDPHNYGRSLLFATESSLSLLRPPPTPLRAGGEIIQIVLRLLGPLFFGLMLLAIRARVKR